jgi:hypothetical protein
MLVLRNITCNIDENVIYLNNIVKNGNYENIIFMGTSARCYASILFSSLLKIQSTHITQF